MGPPDRFEWPNRLLTPTTDIFVAVARRQKWYYVQNAGLPASKFRVIYNGVDLDRFQPGEPDHQLVKELGIKRGQRIVGLVSMLRPEKNVSLLLRAAKQVLSRQGNVRFVIVGDGPARKALAQEAQQLGVAENTIFTGLRSDVERLLRTFDVVVLSSNHEAFPVTLLEAGACGKPVVATAVGAVDEIVVHGQTGYLVRPGSEVELAGALLRLLRDDSRRAAMGVAARNHIEDRFGLDVMVQQYESLFDELLTVKGLLGPKAKARIRCRAAGVAGSSAPLLTARREAFE